MLEILHDSHANSQSESELVITKIFLMSIEFDMKDFVVCTMP